ncbi:MAG: hypothetical protein MUD12_06260 [Spirochaetes bacterium]|jgi:hypothetical protein|nr:hypothetical protein [Spirochaetota bacterium]
MIKKSIRKIASLIGNSIPIPDRMKDETELLAIGSMLSNQQYLMNSRNINDYEFRIFSQFGDDGIIQYLIKNIKIENEIFIEFGVQNYIESNTRFLMMNNNWSGFVMDGSEEAMNSLKNQSWYWRYCLTHKAVFIDKENINQLLADTGFSNIGLLHIDLDGNDYHILNEIDLSKLNPSIIILEYNSVFGKDRPITVPYDKKFVRTNAHYSNLFWGASLPALNYATSKKGYTLIGCNLAGNNAYFVKKSLLNDKVKELSVEEAFKKSKYRESRNKDYSLSYLSGNDRLEIIKGLEVINVITNEKEKL